MNRPWKQLSLGTLLGFTLLVAGCGESGTSTISQMSNTVAPAALKAEAEVPPERGSETVAAAGNLARVEAPSGDVTMERCMAQRRYLVFHTNEALDPVNDSNGVNDVYLRDLLTGKVTLVSRNAAGQAGNGPSSNATISADGKRIAYQSLASDLVTGDGNGKSDVFLYTRVGQVTTRVSLTAANTEANDDSSYPALSSNGSFMAFVSKADLTGVGTSGVQNLYFRKVDGSATKLFSAGSGTGANAPVYTPVMTSDSRYIAYVSAASNLVAGDSNGTSDVFLYDRSTGLTQRISVDGSGLEANGASTMPSISDDGNVIAFESKASNLVPNDTNGLRDLFIRNRSAGTTTRVSVDVTGAQSNGISYHATLTRDGSRVAFASQASNLVTGDTNSVADVFQRFVADPTTIDRASRNIVGDVQGDGPSDLPSYDSDDYDLAFRSSSTNLDWANVVSNNEIFLANRASQTAYVVGRAWVPNQTKILDSTGNIYLTFGSKHSQSADGRFVVYLFLTQVYVYDRKLGSTELVSVDSSGTPSNNQLVQGASISANGRFVVFYSDATNLVGGDTNGAPDFFLHDRQTKQTSLVSRGLLNAPANTPQGSYRFYESPYISSDGRFVAFNSAASNLVSSDLNNVEDVFILDTLLSRTELISVDSQGIQGNGSSGVQSISGDGRFVALGSWSTNLVPGDSNGVDDIFVHDRVNRTTICVSVNPSGSPRGSAGSPQRVIPIDSLADLSADGRTIAFASVARDLLPGVGAGGSYIYCRDLQTSVTTRLPVDGEDGAGDYRFGPSISADGRFILHRRSFTPVNPTRECKQIGYDRRSNVSFLISLPNQMGAQLWPDGGRPGLSQDGRFIAYTLVTSVFNPSIVTQLYLTRFLFP